MHADIGRPQYRLVAQRMTSSAKNTMKARIVQFADDKSQAIDGADLIVRADVSDRNIMLRRAEMMREHARCAHGHMVMCDADLIWQRDPSMLFDLPFDIGLMWRSGRPAMPYCGAMIYVRHGSEAAIEFLSDWIFTIKSLPPKLHGWWGDQLALAAMLGRRTPNQSVGYNGCLVHIFDGGQHIFTMKEPDQKAPEIAVARHYKGVVKEAWL